uniref:Uncharacterized protein n=1 Tax=mine drainage metagenome TaxID=410659 RepID=E6QW06_9ZZZZ
MLLEDMIGKFISSEAK